MTASESETKTWAGGRLWTLIVAATVVLTVVLGGTFAIITARSDNDPVAETVTTPPVTGQQADRTGWGTPYLDELGRRVEVPPNANGVALKQDPTLRRDSDAADYRTEPPQGVMWQQVDGGPMPFSTSDGPTGIDGELPTGFAQTPQGAALAAQQFVARMLASKAGALAITSKRAVFDTLQSRQEAIARTAALREWPPVPLGRSEAYRVTYWSRDYAVIELALAPEKEKIQTWTTGRADLLWRDNDWYIKGGPIPSANATGDVATLAGWTVWPGK